MKNRLPTQLASGIVASERTAGIVSSSSVELIRVKTANSRVTVLI